MSKNLRYFLIEKYGGFADGRVKNKDRDYAITINTEWIALGQSCNLSINVCDPESAEITLTMSNAPCDERIADWATSRAAEQYQVVDGWLFLKSTLSSSDITSIRSLAGRLNQLPRRRPSTGSKKTDRIVGRVCKRTSLALRGLARNLEEFQALSPEPTAPSATPDLFTEFDAIKNECDRL